jgi:two-component system, OmpR family, torCAD operon response regulator TorR
MRSGIIRGYSPRIAQIADPLVVVADDDPAFRMLLRINLELEGYRVLEAGNAEEIRFAVAGGDIDLILLDVRLGDDDGIQLAGELRTEHPELKIAFLTGSAFGLANQAGKISDAVIQKPFDLEELSRTVAQLTRR